MNYIKKIERMRACQEAIDWLKEGKYPTLDAAWQVCQRGDWMLWYAGKLSGAPESEKRKKLALAACACARLALPFVRVGENRPLAAIEAAEKWTRGEATIQEVKAAAYAADAAAYAAAAAAAYAADAADAAAAAAAYAADATAYAAARLKILSQCADIVRKYYPVAPARER